MKSKTLNDIIFKHKLWLENDINGEKANLSEANLSGANLRGANLSRADLSGADLRWADLSVANLREANLREADLRGANLSRANLSVANLREADLREANLREANLREANLRGADLIVIQLPFYTAYVQKEHTRIGCKHYSNEEWLNFGDDEILKMDSNALEFWTSYKSLIFAAIDSLQNIEITKEK